jgi:hypothetical protein
MTLPAAEHARVQRETKDRRNAAARARRLVPDLATQLATPPRLFLTLPGVVSWQRPRQQPLRNGAYRTAYPPGYESGREVWRTVVGAGVRASSWRAPPVAAPLCVTAKVVAPGKLDLDRVLTAVLDALEAGGALVDDCRVWHLYAQRRRPWPEEAPHVDVLLTTATTATAEATSGGGSADGAGRGG